MNAIQRIPRLLSVVVAVALAFGAACDSLTGPGHRAPVELHLVKVSGDGQTATVGEQLPEPLVVQVRDARGNGLPGVPVWWNAAASEMDVTDQGGFARALWTLDVVGLHQVTWVGIAIEEEEGGDTVVVGPASVEFSAVARPGPIASVRIVSDMIPILNLVGSTPALLYPATIRMKALAFDAHGNPVESASFVWSSSDPAVITAAPESPGNARVVVVTHGAGSALLHVSTSGVSSSLPVRVAAVPAPFRVTPLGLSSADALNDRGEIVGSIGYPGSHNRLALWREGATTVLDVVSAEDCLLHGTVVPEDRTAHCVSAAAINNNGAILFLTVDPLRAAYGITRNWILRGGVLTRIVDANALLFDINDSDEVVGKPVIDGRRPPPLRQWAENYGFLWRDGELSWIRDLAEPSLLYTIPVAINNRSQVAVNLPYVLSGDYAWRAAYLWDAGQYTPIPSPAAACIEWPATDLNNLGQLLVHCHTSPPQPPRAFLWDGASFTPLAPITHATGLNDRGEVVGGGGDGVYLWRNGVAIRLLAVQGVEGVRINNAGQIILNYGGLGYLVTLTP